MKFVRELEVEDQIVGFFRVSSKQVRETRSGKPYLDLSLSDKTGEINAKMWEDPEAKWDEIGPGDVVKVQARVDQYDNKLQLILQRVRAALPEDADAGYDASRFEESSEYDIDAMWEELWGYAEGLSEPLKSLATGLLEERRENFCRGPASSHLHHPYVGGLLEHTLNVVRTCDYFSGRYPVRRDLLLAGAILHDIGKLEEIRPHPENEYTMSGKLIGHTVQGWGMMQVKANELGTLDENILTLLGHLILSHQGRPEWNAPRVPQTLEAMVLHYADDLDAKVEIFRRAVERDPNEGEFTPRHRTMGREFYKSTYQEVQEGSEGAPAPSNDPSDSGLNP